MEVSSGITEAPSLVLGPLLSHWPAERRRDFYYRIADEADIDVVCVGEVVCAKRSPLFSAYLSSVLERLQHAGKAVVRSTLALVVDDRDLGGLAAVCDEPDVAIEANDMAAALLMRGRPFTLGPFVNVYNEGTLRFLASCGAIRACPPAELSQRSLGALAAAGACDIEAQVFGRIPLALSARCISARVHGLSRDRCRQVCGDDPDGMAAETLDGQPFVAVSGHVVLSAAVTARLRDLARLRFLGIRHFRLYPTGMADMVGVGAVFREV
ncbi:MAG: U32 family peptidase, partial [Proteobacteria bacterium]|nr:U32 family peptidase [Pseudomonadota bacterium]